VETSLLESLLEATLINIVLSGDNAVVIGLAARNLPRLQQRRAIMLGGLTAVVLRLALTLPAELLLRAPYLRAGGGLLLAWVAYRLLMPGEDKGQGAGVTGVAAAVRLIVIADATMSLDNVLAVAAIADRSASGPLVLAISLALSIPVVMFGGAFIAALLGRAPWLTWVGAAILTFTAAGLMVDDEVARRLIDPTTALRLGAGAVLTLIVLGLAWWTSRHAGSEPTVFPPAAG
jgi:YjbE family integral membrane protein